MGRNKNYNNGRAKEYRIRDRLLSEGYLETVRTAGSHGRFDVIAIDPVNKRIMLVQSKGGKSQKTAIRAVEATGIIEDFSGNYRVEVQIL